METRKRGTISNTDSCAQGKRHHVTGMTSDNLFPTTNYEFPNRLIVKARLRSGANKGYFWAIVRDNQACSVIRQSPESYRSMAEAYTVGSVVLAQTLVKKTTKTKSSVHSEQRLLFPQLDVSLSRAAVSPLH